MEYFNKLLRKGGGASSTKKHERPENSPKTHLTPGRDQDFDGELPTSNHSSPKKDCDTESDTTADYESAGELSPWKEKPTSVSALAESLAQVHVSTPKLYHKELEHFPYSPLTAEDEDEEVISITSNNSQNSISGSLSLMKEETISENSVPSIGSNAPFALVTSSLALLNPSDKGITSTSNDFKIIPDSKTENLITFASLANSNSLDINTHEANDSKVISPFVEFEDAGPTCSFHSEIMSNMSMNISVISNSSLIEGCKGSMEACEKSDSCRISLLPTISETNTEGIKNLDEINQCHQELNEGTPPISSNSDSLHILNKDVMLKVISSDKKPDLSSPACNKGSIEGAETTLNDLSNLTNAVACESSENCKQLVLPTDSIKNEIEPKTDSTELEKIPLKTVSSEKQNFPVTPFHVLDAPEGNTVINKGSDVIVPAQINHETASGVPCSELAEKLSSDFLPGPKANAIEEATEKSPNDSISPNSHNISDSVLRLSNEKHPVCIEESPENLGVLLSPLKIIQSDKVGDEILPDVVKNNQETNDGNLSIREMCTLIEATFNSTLKDKDIDEKLSGDVPNSVESKAFSPGDKPECNAVHSNTLITPSLGTPKEREANILEIAEDPLGESSALNTVNTNDFTLNENIKSLNVNNMPLSNSLEQKGILNTNASYDKQTLEEQSISKVPIELENDIIEGTKTLNSTMNLLELAIADMSIKNNSETTFSLNNELQENSSEKEKSASRVGDVLEGIPFENSDEITGGKLLNETDKLLDVTCNSLVQITSTGSNDPSHSIVLDKSLDIPATPNNSLCSASQESSKASLDPSQNDISIKSDISTKLKTDVIITTCEDSIKDQCIKPPSAVLPEMSEVAEKSPSKNGMMSFVLSFDEGDSAKKPMNLKKKPQLSSSSPRSPKRALEYPPTKASTKPPTSDVPTCPPVSSDQEYKELGEKACSASLTSENYLDLGIKTDALLPMDGSESDKPGPVIEGNAETPRPHLKCDLQPPLSSPGNLPVVMVRSYEEVLAECSRQEELLGFDESIKKEADKIANYLSNDSENVVKEVPQAMKSSEASSKNGEEDFQDATCFDFEYLSNIRGKPGQHKLTRESLFLKFDPLAVSATTPESQTKTKTETALADSSSDPPTTPQAVNREEILVSITPAQQLEKPPSPSPSSSSVTPRHGRFRPSPVTPTLRHEMLSREIAKLQGLMLQQETSYEEQITAYIKEIEELQCKLTVYEQQMPLEAAKAEIEELKTQLQNKQVQKVELMSIIEEFEKVCLKLATDKSELENDKRKLEEEKAKLEEENADLRKELESTDKHLTNMETAFNDVHLKYEKCKQAIEQFKSNEEAHKKAHTANKAAINDLNEKCEKLRESATIRLELANTEIAEMKKAHQVQLTTLEAINRKLQMEVKNLKETIEQKNRETAELTKICDELIKVTSR